MNSNLPVMPQQNLAPAKPIYALSERRESGQYLADALRELIHDFLQRDREVFRDVANTSEVVSNFIQGKQIWQKSDWTGEWRIVRPSSNADPNRVTAINIMQFYATTQVKMFTSSNPDLEPADQYKQREYREKVKVAKAVWNHYESKFYTPRFNQQEALHAIVSGTYVESVRYDQMKRGSKFFREITQNKRVRLNDGYSRCFSCGAQGGYDDFVKQPEEGQPAEFPKCPNCGSHEVMPPEEPMEQDYSSVTGVQPVQMGDLDIRLIPIQTLRFNVRVPVEESSWAVERIQMEESKLRYLLGDLDFQFSDNETDDGLKALEHISRAGNTIAGQDTDVMPSPLTRPAIVDRVTIKPEDVSHIKLNEDTVTLAGVTLPKDSRLSDIIPEEGATVLAVNDGGIIIGMYFGSHHSNEMSSGTYHMRLESGLGRGSEDTVEVQKRFNRNDWQISKFGEATATPGHTVVAGAVKRAHMRKIGHPQAIIPVSKSVAMALKTTELVRQLPPGTVGAQFFQYTYDILNQYRQLTSHSTDFSNAFPGVDNATATGARLAKSNAESVFSPALQIKSFVRIGTAQNTIKLRSGPQFQGLNQWFNLGQTPGQRPIGRNVQTEEIDCDIEFTVVRDSEQPKTMYDRQVDFVNMMNVAAAGGGYTQIKATDPKLADAMLKAFDIDIDDETMDMITDVCEERLEQALELQSQYQMFTQVAQAQGMPLPPIPPEAALAGLEPAIATEEPNHMQKAKWFMDYLDCPDGTAMSNDQREIVKMFVREHAKQEAMQQGLIMRLQQEAALFAQQPAVDQQNQQMQDQANAEAQRQGQAEMQRSEQDRQAQNDQRAQQRDDQAAQQAANMQQNAFQSILDTGLRMYEAENSPVPPTAGAGGK